MQKRKRILKPREALNAPIPAKELRDWRLARDWSQEDAAKWLGVKLPTYQSWEQPKSKRNMRHPIMVRSRMQMARIRTKEEA